MNMTIDENQWMIIILPTPVFATNTYKDGINIYDVFKVLVLMVLTSVKTDQDLREQSRIHDIPSLY